MSNVLKSGDVIRCHDNEDMYDHVLALMTEGYLTKTEPRTHEITILGHREAISQGE